MAYRKIFWNKGWLGKMYWIAPVDSLRLQCPMTQQPEGNKAGVGLVIMDDYIESPIGSLFGKYLDTSYVWHKKYANGETFSEWGKFYYSYENIHAIAEMMRRIADLIEEDYDNPLIDEYKDFYLFSVMPSDDPDFESRYTDDTELGKILLRKRAPVIIRLYRDLADALNKIMEAEPDCDTICLSYHPTADQGTVSEEDAELIALKWN